MLFAALTLLLAGARGETALERALEGVRAEAICADVRFIAADELEGRDTPSQGLRLAARYLRARLERLGFQPAGDDGYFDHYELEQVGLDLASTGVWIRREGREQELALGADFAFFGDGELALEGDVVFVGAGRAEDIQGLELAGKWALVVDGQAGRSREVWEERARRMERLQAAGALGLLSAPDPGLDAQDAAERDRRLAQLAAFVRRPRLRLPGSEEPGPDRGVSVSLSSARARELLGSTTPAPGTALGARLVLRRKSAPLQRIVLENVAGLWPGSDPTLGTEVVILTAHYDHEGVQEGQIYNGADDNGSGTCALLALAEALARHGPMRRSVLLLWVSGEEKGLLGSQAWTKQPTLAAGCRAICALNLDMIGRNAPDKLLVTPSSEHPEYNGLTRLAESVARLEGFPSLGHADEYWGRSDHASFARNLGLPVAFLFSDVHEDYHQPTDDAEKIDCDKIRRVTRLILRMLDGLQAEVLDL